MPSSADDGPEVLLDTSAAVALVVADHEGHASTLAAAGTRQLGLAGHAWFETYSVLTRLPGASRRRPGEVEHLLSRNFPASRFLDADAHHALTARLAASEIAGGAVYDALVGATAVLHGRPLLSRDRRAADTYRRLGVDVELMA